MLLAASLLGAAGIQYAINGFSTLACLWQFPLLTAGMLAGLVLLFLLVLFVSTLFVDPKKMVEKPSAYFRFMLNQFCRLALFLGGVHVHITGLEKVPRKSRFMLISNHAFVDGNKRIGMYVLLTFLETNGIKIRPSNEEVVRIGLATAAGEMKYEDILAWILENE